MRGGLAKAVNPAAALVLCGMIYVGACIAVPGLVSSASGRSMPAGARSDVFSCASPQTGDPKERPIPPDKAASIPADWTTYADTERGYKLRLPKGTVTDSRVTDGFDRFIASVPPPRKTAVMVICFRESTFTKDELLEAAKRTLEKLGEGNIKVDSRSRISDDYELAHLSSSSGNGIITRLKVLLGTNGLDNYVLLVGSPEPSFKDDEQEIDAIWSSFVMLGRSDSQSPKF